MAGYITYTANTLPMALADLFNSISHLVKILLLLLLLLLLPITVYPRSSPPLTILLGAVCHPMYLPYFANSSSALNLSMSSSLKQIPTAISPSSVLGIR